MSGCLGFTTYSVSRAAVPKLMRNAGEGNMSKMLSPGRSSDCYFLEMRTQSLKKGWGFLHMGTKAYLGQTFGKAESWDAAPGLFHCYVQ